MSKYGSILYDQSTYGQKSRLTFSFEPFTSVALDYTTVSLKWSSPVGSYTAVKLLRNQEGFSETIEDGSVIYEEYGIDPVSGTMAISNFSDGKNNLAELNPPLIGGKFAYYRFWLLKSDDKVWYPAGDTFCLIPSQHPTYGPDKTALLTTHDRFMNLIPRTFTSASQSPIDEVSADSDLHRFITGMSFTVDEFLTMAESLMPDFSGSKTSPTIISSQATQLGLTREPKISVKHQKRMIREAIYMYRNKGKLDSVSTLIESLTGYDSTLITSPNLMLSNSDSTFYKGLGFWQNVGDCTLELDDVTPITSESLTIDRLYSAKVTVNSVPNTSIRNGTDYPITRGIPVEVGGVYNLTYYIKTDLSVPASCIPSVVWYDYKGEEIYYADYMTIVDPVTTTWNKQVVELAAAPEGAVYAGLIFSFSDVGVFNLDQIQFAEAPVTDYHEARGLTAQLNPKKTNYVADPSFEAVTTLWSTDGEVVTETTAPQILTGDKVLKLSSGSSSAFIDVAQGLVPTGGFVTLSLYGKSVEDSETATLSIESTFDINIYSALVSNNIALLTVQYGHPAIVGNTILVSGLGAPFDGTQTITMVSPTQIAFIVGGSDIDETPVTGLAKLTKTFESTVTLTSTWSRVQSSAYIPVEFLQTYTAFTVGIYGEFVGDAYIDGVQFEPTFGATEYFDGDYGTERDALWDGTPSASVSFMYPNKIINVSRLADEIVKFLPNDTPWMITSQSGIEASGFTD